MFTLADYEEYVRLAPQELGLPRLSAVRRLLKRQFLNTVDDGGGLVVALGDVHDIRGGMLHPGEAAMDLVVRFSLVLFRPFVGEIVVGTLVRCDDKGLYVSLGFFGDVFVPASCLPEGSRLCVRGEPPPRVGGVGVGWRREFGGRRPVVRH